MQPLRVQFQNVNDDRNTPSHLTNFALDKRFSDIVASHHEIYVLSEISIRYLDFVISYLRNAGYETAHMAYSPNQVPDMSFYHVIAWLPHITCKEIRPYWFTGTPTIPLTPDTRKVDTVLITHAEEWEKGALNAVFTCEHKHVIISGNHFGLKRFREGIPQYTDTCARMLASMFAELTVEYPGYDIIAGSDFNAFSDSTHTDIFLEASGFIDLTPMTQSFIAYPWDLGLLRPENRDYILAAKDEMKLLTGSDYINRAKTALQHLYGNPLISRIDRIFASREFKVDATIDMSKFTLDDFTDVPVCCSDHAGYVVEI